MITIGFDTSACNIEILDYLLMNQNNFSIHLYPSNIDELIQGINFDDANYLAKCAKIKYFYEKDIRVICGSWRKDIDFLSKEISFYDWANNRYYNDKLIECILNIRYPSEEHKKVLEDRNFVKALISAWLLKLRIKASLITYIIRYEKAQNKEDSRGMKVALEKYENLHNEYLNECSDFENKTLKELKIINKKLKGEAIEFEDKKNDVNELLDSFNLLDLRAEIIKRIADDYVSSDLECVDSSFNNTGFLYSTKIFLYCFWSLLINYVWGCIVKPSEYRVDCLMNSIIGDAEMIGYAAKCRTNLFVTKDKAQALTSKIIFNRILRMKIIVIYLNGLKGNNLSALNQIFFAKKMLNEAIFYV